MTVRRMSITFLLPGYPWRPIGGFRAVYEYSNQLVARGHRVTVIHSKHFSGWSPQSPQHLLGRAKSSLGNLRDLVLKPRIRWQKLDARVETVFIPRFYIDALPQADALLATGWQTVEDVMCSPAEKGRKFYLIQGYEVWGGETEQVHATWRAPLKKMVVSDWLLRKGIELGVPPGEMVHVPNGLDHGLFRALCPVWPREPRVAMLYGPGLKGGEDGMEALMAVKARFPSLKAVLFSAWHRRPLNLPTWIEYVHRPHPQILVQYIYNKSSIYLCPSWSEGWGLPAAEAMACGCAVVSTDNGGVRDYATHGETALLSPPKLPEKLAENLMTLLLDEKLRTTLAEAGQTNIRRFTWNSSADIMEQVFLDSLLGCPVNIGSDDSEVRRASRIRKVVE